MPVDAQITILLALTGGLFDTVPVERMAEAERAVKEAAGRLPADLRTRFESAEQLADEDRTAVLALARTALLPFVVPPAPSAAAAS